MTISRAPEKGAVLITQNYYTPYRAALYEELVRRGLDITVAYAQTPEEEERQWRMPSFLPFSFTLSRNVKIGRAVFFPIPLSCLRRQFRIVVVNDNNPTNICMIFWVLIFRLLSKRCALWVEHIPDFSKPGLKQRFQRICTRTLAWFSEVVFPLSAKTEEYLKDVGVNRPTYRLIQAVQPPKEPPQDRHSAIRSFGFLGSNSPRKNFQALLRAFRALSLMDKRLIVGGFADDPVDETVQYLGYLDDGARDRFFASVDALLLPSLADPWGLVVNEALERGCLCAVSSCCGSAELVRAISPKLVFDPSES